MKPKTVKKIFSQFKNIPVNHEFLRELRGKLETQTSFDVRGAVKTPAFGFKRIASATTLASILLGSTGTVFASRASLPGETLYPVKRLVENVRLAATVDQKTKADIRLGIAKERLTEINFLLAEKHARNSSSSQEFEDNIKEAATNFDSQLKQVAEKAEDLEKVGELENALRINTEIYFSGKNYKKLIEENKESSPERIKNRLEDSSKENDKATENAKEHMERLRIKGEEDKGSKNSGSKETSIKVSGQATISENHGISDEKTSMDSESQTTSTGSPGGKVESGSEKEKQTLEDAKNEQRNQDKETNSVQIKIEL